MKEILEYYLVSGKIRIGKKELMFELLRKDSILRGLLGLNAGNLNSVLSNANLSDKEDHVVIDFGQWETIKLDHDPTQELNELKKRYGENIGGTLAFRLDYATYKINACLIGNLDASHISLLLSGSSGSSGFVK